jgi:hypothetical protein
MEILPCFESPDLLCSSRKIEQVIMTLEQAKKLVKSCAEQMHARYGKVVFDEWAIISLADKKGRILDYLGPRREGFAKHFLEDAGSLRSGLLSTEHEAGDYEFARHGVGTGFEAFVVLGKGIYLICNNTAESMDSLTKDPKWLGAQVPFVELSDKFRTDGLSI